MKRKLLKFGLSLFLFMVASHFYSRAWLGIERDFTLRFYEAKENYIVAHARNYNLVDRDSLPDIVLYQLHELTIEDIIEREALAYDLNPSLIRSVIQTESAWNQDAVSSAGAIGLMQVMPSHVEFCGLPSAEALFNPVINIACGVQILDNNIKHFSGDIIKGLMYYNGGNRCYASRPNNPCKETANYPILVLRHWARDNRI